MNNNKLSVIAEILWLTLSLIFASLLSDFISDEFGYSNNFLLNIFSYILSSYPIWIRYLCYWYFESNRIPKKIFIIFLIFPFLMSIWIENISYNDFATFFPIICAILLFFLEKHTYVFSVLIKNKKKIIVGIFLVFLTICIFAFLNFYLEKIETEKQKKEYLKRYEEFSNNFDFPDYSHKDENEAISIKKFLTNIDTIGQKESLLISDVAFLDKIEPHHSFGFHYSVVILKSDANKKKNLIEFKPELEIRFVLTNQEAKKLEEFLPRWEWESKIRSKIKFMGVLKKYENSTRYLDGDYMSLEKVIIIHNNK